MPHSVLNLYGVIRLAGGLLSICAVVSLASPAMAVLPGTSAPTAVLTATTASQSKAQTARVIYSDWEGESYDRSRPPVRWPRRLRVPGTSTFTIQLHTPLAPSGVEVRAWAHLRPNGIPRGRPEFSECRRPPSMGTTGTCTLVPMITTSGVVWQIQFDLERSKGPYYLAVSAVWEDAQVAWINHVKLNN